MAGRVAGASLLRTLQRLPGSAFQGEAATSVARSFAGHGFSALAGSSAAAPSSSAFSLQGATQGANGFNMQARNSLPFSFAAHMHSLGRKDDEQGSPVIAGEVPKVPTALSALPPKPKMMTQARRSMASAADEAPHIDSTMAHPFHILPGSPWPYYASMGAMTSLLGMAGWFHAIPGTSEVMYAGVASVAATALAWWRDCIIEADMGMHSELQKKNLLNGVWLFIVSEAVLFVGLLWSCVHLGMSPNVWVQMQWPPVGIEAIGWEGRALVMSAVLAASYYSANVAVVAKDPKVVLGALGTTTALGALFLADQYLEYTTAPFTITDSPYGSTFFVTTGFHGFHVLLGSIWLAAAMANYSKTNKPTTNLKGAVLYWHFVDIVWIAVYGIIYAAQL
mmetsp:Transcript_8103/g.21594  ORF Transcript_8103/g.21594 Transcript_8103/m.21594 type:complete len:393 (+) Transcript_8103:101-1279(+)|eukprot:CAMPEP_0202347520 /NCGR_PEP_ID=MMETSP1126-20121109/5846_1 /ASSEMBLY_ACC=CAM_ASM_000457 /TAXON_ID=3047 /ORGANISM="Dunaliella tertiolecta, Strain CCMP1320" /LENGTH=392 /DNA_ID=CAMNT_0048939081 /DNA_START=87 /DNA_END=1265 /DNA_ORIENTATION=+